VRLGLPLLAQLDAWAEQAGITRAEAIRRIIWAGLNG
jgi:predicted DNA-binding protein